MLVAYNTGYVHIFKRYFCTVFLSCHDHSGHPEAVSYTHLDVYKRQPEKHPIVEFDSFFKLFHDYLDEYAGQKVHFELGRALVAQCGSLISKVLYIKNGINTNFMILDAGMTELIRPALYQAYHKIENISNIGGPLQRYDVVGPICESSCLLYTSRCV